MFTHTLSQVLSFAIVSAIGYLLAKMRLIDDRLTTGMFMLITHVGMPGFILSSSQMDYSPDKLMGILQVIAFSAVYFTFTLAVLPKILALLPMADDKRKALHLCSIYGNVGFMGFPIIAAFLGQEGVFYGSIFNVFFNITLFTFGIKIMTQGTAAEGKSGFSQSIKQPPVIAAVLMVLIFILQIKFPPALMSAINIMSNLTTPLSMLVIGVLMAKMALGDVFTEPITYVVSLIKLAAIPVVVGFALYLLNFNPTVAIVCIIVSAMPTGSLLGAFSHEFQVAPDLFAKNIVITMLLLIVSFPIIAWFTFRLFPI